MSTMFIGEALVGENPEIAHIDLIIGSKDGPVGTAFANALARQSEGHSNLLAVLQPNLPVKPSTVIVTKVTIKGARQAIQMFGPAQFAVAKAVADSVGGEDKPINKTDAERFVIICGVFIHWEAGSFPKLEEKAAQGDEGQTELAAAQAASNKRIYDFNYEATKQAIAVAMRERPTVEEMLAQKDEADHPFKGF